MISDIPTICKRYGIKNYTINPDGSVDVDGDVTFYNRGLDILPLKFNRVRGSFHCQFNRLTRLKGCPNYVGGHFQSSNNELTSLEGAPEYVGGSFQCNSNRLNNLIGSPKKVIRYFSCRFNNIRDFYGYPENHYGSFYCEGNPIYHFLPLVPEEKRSKLVQLLNDYGVIRNGKTVIKDRLEAAYEGIGMELPELDITILRNPYEII